MELAIDLELVVVRVADEAGVGIFQDLHDTDVGRVLMQRNSVFWDHFSKWLDTNPNLKHTFLKGTVQDEETFRHMVSVDLGSILKKSEWWKNHIKEILATKRRHKIARAVMES